MENLCVTERLPAAAEGVDAEVFVLNELQLALVGGGIGDVVGH
jgi:hypothetical protein